MRSRWRRRLARAREVGGALIARDTMVVTNAIAFNFLLCLFPLLLVLTAVAQAFPGRRASAALLLVLHELIPFEREALAQSVQGLRRIAPGLQIFSLLVIVWGSSGIFMPIEMALGRAWGCEPRSFVRSRLLAFLATLGGASIA
ncbi:MAG: YhjD/YihY/BrkB family envelope integrity protein, partial [Vicinamibacteria bacterium]